MKALDEELTVESIVTNCNKTVCNNKMAMMCKQLNDEKSGKKCDDKRIDWGKRTREKFMKIKWGRNYLQVDNARNKNEKVKQILTT